MSSITLHMSGDDSITMNSTTTGKYAARRVAESLGYDDSVQYQLFLWSGKGPIRVDEDEIMAPYDNYSVARLKGV